MSEQAFHHWRAGFGGLRVDPARRLKQLETENGRLKRPVAELTLDNEVLKEAVVGRYWVHALERRSENCQWVRLVVLRVNYFLFRSCKAV